jgi:primosomal protein N' (replication factor Y)
LAETTKMPIVRMQEAAKKGAITTLSVVNLRDKDRFGRNRQLSDALLKAIEKRLVNKEQSLLFLNRRGTARLILCQTCGWQAMCPNCDLPLTFHGDFHELRCHTCGYHTDPPFACPECSGTELRYQSIGTKALVDMLYSLFPEARIRRFDTDTGAKDTLDKHYQAVKAGEVDILVGTQMLGKGLDLPRLSLVGIVTADTSLAIPDYSSAERSYQLLHQAIGRVGRGHLPGEVIVQTHNPDNPILQAAVKRNWHDLYQAELVERKAFKFPPYRFLAKVGVSRKTTASAEKAAHTLYQQLLAANLAIEPGEPTPAFYEQSHGLYHWQIIIKSTKRSELLAAIKALKPGDWTFDLDPINLL